MILVQIVAATLLCGVVSVLVTALAGARVPARMMRGIVLFAAGVLLTMAGAELIPHGLSELGFPATVLVLAGAMFVFHGVERLRPRETIPLGQGADAARTALVPALLAGDGLHNAVDGVLIAAAFLEDPALGWTMAVGVALHEIPQEFGDYMLLVWAGMRPSEALTWNLASGFCAVLGGVAGYVVLQRIDGLLPYALVLSAASFLYIAGIGILPRLFRGRQPLAQLPGLAWLLAGATAVLALDRLVA